MRCAADGEIAPVRPWGALEVSPLTTAVSRRPVSSLADCREADTTVRAGAALRPAEAVAPDNPGTAVSRCVDADLLDRAAPLPLGRAVPLPLGRAVPLPLGRAVPLPLGPAVPLRGASWGRPVAGIGRDAGGDVDADPRRPGAGDTDS